MTDEKTLKIIREIREKRLAGKKLSMRELATWAAYAYCNGESVKYWRLDTAERMYQASWITESQIEELDDVGRQMRHEARAAERQIEEQ